MADFSTYQEQLATQEWDCKRSFIIHRDNSRCTICGKSKSIQINDCNLNNFGINYNIPRISKDNILSIKEYPLSEYKKQNNITRAQIKSITGLYPQSEHIYYHSLLRFNDSELVPSDIPKNIIINEKEHISVYVIHHKNGFIYKLVSLGSQDICSKNYPIAYFDKNEIVLNVHHKYYIYNYLAWEYDDHALITVCQSCHKNIHENSTIKVYLDQSLQKEMNYTPCHRCNGVGYFSEFAHVNNGVCFRCNGARYEELISSKFEELHD